MVDAFMECMDDHYQIWLELLWNDNKSPKWEKIRLTPQAVAMVVSSFYC